jgi:hypothetical protein
MTDDFSSRTSTGSEQQSVDKNGFAGACFTCQDRQPGVQLEFYRVDNSEIANLYMSQHRSNPEKLVNEVGWLHAIATPPAQLRSQDAVVVVLGRM